jgi:hypothetical protein
MSISPFHAPPAPSEGDRPGTGQRRARLAILIAAIGIAATLAAYAISPSVRHAVSHATHSVKHAVGNVLDPEATKQAHLVAPAPSTAQVGKLRLVVTVVAVGGRHGAKPSPMQGATVRVLSRGMLLQSARTGGHGRVFAWLSEGPYRLEAALDPSRRACGVRTWQVRSGHLHVNLGCSIP